MKIINETIEEPIDTNRENEKDDVEKVTITINYFQFVSKEF